MAAGGVSETIIDRSPEKSFLLSAVGLPAGRAGRSSGAIVAIQAPSGIGKSHLVDHVVAELASHGKIVFSRIESPSSLTHVSFRTIVLTALLRAYIEGVERGNPLPNRKSLLFSPRRKKALTKGLRSVIDGVSFGGASALQSLFAVAKTRGSTSLDDIVLDDIETEEGIDTFFDAVSQEVLPAIALSNAQRLSENALLFLLERAHRWKARLFLEYTMSSFDQGAVDREQLHEIASGTGLAASALTLSPLQWNKARLLNQELGEDDAWARQYYERHGFNLFDLRNLKGPAAEEYESAYFEDISFGPSFLPGLKAPFPATLHQIKGTSRGAQLVLCILGLHGDYLRDDILKAVLPPVAEEVDAVLRALLQHGLAKAREGTADHRAYALAHESVWRAIEKTPHFFPLLKLAAKAWQSFYELTASDPGRPQGPYQLERLIRLAYFSAAVSDAAALLSTCQKLCEASKTMVVDGEFRESFRTILSRSASSSLIPEKAKPLISYYLGTAALNFGDTEIADEACSALPANSLGALTLGAFIHLRNHQYVQARALLSSLSATCRDEIGGGSATPIELAEIIARSGMAHTAEEISEANRAYRVLLTKAKKVREEIIVLKHASMAFGYVESLAMIDEAVRCLDGAGKSYEADQARLIKLMQLTRLGLLPEAHQLAGTLDGRFPRNFGEIGNLWNILGILACYDPVSRQPVLPPGLDARHQFLRALEARSDEFSRIVLYSNLFVFDHFLAGDTVSEAQRTASRAGLETILEGATTGFRYLYVLGWYNLMRYHEAQGEIEKASEYRARIGPMTKSDSLLWRAAMGASNGKGTEVEFLTRTHFMFAFLPNYELSPPVFANCVESIPKIICS